ncbi:MAG: sugar ABC transporter permease YjfF [Anaeromicrobium sp.]|uniref:galactofuranose ABC transporter, permease protein YjfF n=1 Tax=Anaeromicrobium sp. TaxID=1929132 RepID=UPI0025EA5CFB|nr:galactofuranose ABC transporter, permease protein YjfF [Anaeromicrobium sp.]MCT4596058.1 sugar ABC transporter permease YjfF [Anaeromicrobium sp.]
MKNKIKINQNNISLIATISLFLILYMCGGIKYSSFFKPQVFLNLFIDNAYLIIVATGLAFVIITGGIDLSVGAVVALISVVSAKLLQMEVNPIVVIISSISLGGLFGLFQGVLVCRYEIHPWIVTLGGMFLARGVSFLITTESIVITDELFNIISKNKIYVYGKNFISISVVLAVAVVILGLYVSKYTEFGRNIYAIGGSEDSALLMGIPVQRTKILVYVLCSSCAALGGLVFTFYMLSGYGLHCNGMELDAIASCVVGGILLTGGYGYIIGPLFGVLSTGVIQNIVIFQGTLSSWWTKIAIGFLLFIFIVLQRIIVIYKEREKTVV